MATFFSSNRCKPIKFVLCIFDFLLNPPASSEYKSIAIDDNNRYYEDLSKSNSGQASRYPLAFFVCNICLASQAKHIVNTAPYYLSQGKTVYDGLTLQNKRALRRICRAVSVRTESKTRHPISSVLITVYSVALTQNLTGDSYHG